MTSQLELFATDASQSVDARVRSTAGNLENFGWWCKHGDREMCTAFLKRSGWSDADARSAVTHFASAI
jgi:hypothetical protein